MDFDFSLTYQIGACILFVFLIVDWIRNKIVISNIIKELNITNDELTKFKTESNLNLTTIKSNFSDVDKRIQKSNMDIQSLNTSIDSKLRKLQTTANRKIPSVFSPQYQAKLNERTNRQSETIGQKYPRQSDGASSERKSG
jgi:hypothetical protein